MEIRGLKFQLFVLFATMATSYSDLPTYYMDEWCSTTLDLGIQRIEAGRLLLRAPERGMRFLNCFVFFKAPAGRRLSFRFLGFDIQSPFDCNKDHLQLFDDNVMRHELTGPMCNGGLLPEGVYTTTGQDGTVKLYKKNYLGDQIEVIFTSFHLAPCTEGEFLCSNSHCIAQDLHCNGYDNCADGSDMCLLSTAGIAGVIVAAIIFVIIIAVVIAVVLYKRQQHRRREKLRMYQGVVALDEKGRPIMLQGESPLYLDVWDKKSFVTGSRSPSTAPSTTSSRLSQDRDTSHKVPLDSPAYADVLDNGRLKPQKRHSSKASKSLFGPSRSSTLKKSNSENGLRDIYAEPKKLKRFGLKRKSSSLKYVNNPELYQQDFARMAPSFGMFDRNPSFREGMKGEGESRLPVHVLDPSSLPGADKHLQGPDVYDHVISFRSYPSLEQSRREKAVYLYPGHPRYNRLSYLSKHLPANGHPSNHYVNHDPKEPAQSDHGSLHSSRSSLVKL